MAQRTRLPALALVAALLTLVPAAPAPAAGPADPAGVRAWETDEPALDMTGAAILAGAAQLSLHADPPVQNGRVGAAPNADPPVQNGRVDR